MTPLFKFGAAIAAVILIAVLGVGLLRGGGTSIGGPGATPTSGATATPSASGPAAVPRACALLTNAEVGTALALSSDVTSGPASGSNADVDYCVYRATGSEIVDLTYRNVGGGPVFDALSHGTGVQPVSGLGDRAAWDPAQKTLYIQKGSRFVEVAGVGGSTPMTLEIATAIGTILATRM